MWLGAVLWCIALSAPLKAEADPTLYAPPAEHWLEPELPEMGSCPSAEVPVLAEEGEGEIPPDLRELGHARIEQQEACQAVSQRLDRLVERLWWAVDELVEPDAPQLKLSTETNEWLELVAQRLQSPLSVKNVGEGGGAQLVTLDGPVEVSNQPNDELELLRQAVLDGAETGNQNVWGLAGFFTGFLLLALIYKIVRP